MPNAAATADGLSPNQPYAKKIVEPTVWRAIPHFLPLGIFPLIWLAILFGGWWLLPAFVFKSVTGLFDRLLGIDGESIDPFKTPERKLLWHNIPVWGWAFLWPPTLIFGMWQILVAGQLSVWESVAVASDPGHGGAGCVCRCP